MGQDAGGIHASIGASVPELEKLSESIERARERIRLTGERCGENEQHAWASALDFGAEGEICYSGYLLCMRCGKTMRTHPRTPFDDVMPLSFGSLLDATAHHWTEAERHLGIFASRYAMMMSPVREPGFISRVLERRVFRGESLEAAQAIAVGAYCRIDGMEYYPFLEALPVPPLDGIDAVFRIVEYPPFDAAALGKRLAVAAAQPPAEKRAFDQESQRMMNRIIIGKGGRKRSNPMGRRR